MIVGIVVGLAFFVALVPVLFAGYREGPREAQRPSGSGYDDHVGRAEECVLCHAPLPHLGTADQAVTDIERRIATDRRDVAAGPGRRAGDLARGER